MERNMSGRVYGVGVGPGDPELMTLKAVRILKAADVVICAGKSPEESAAYRIASQAVPDIKKKETISIHVPMTYDREMQEAEHRKTADRISRFLDQGKMVACLVLGDPSIYSSYCYYQQILIQKGYQAEMISGVPSFCAGAAKLNIPLIEWQEQMHIIPAAHQEDLSAYASGTNVYMKTGRRLKELKEHLQKDDTDVYMVENCGMEGERVCLGTNQLPDLSRYYVTVVVKNK